MATTTVTHPVGFPQPKQIARQGVVVAIVLVIGVGLGLLFDSGRANVSVEAAQLTQGQQAAADRLNAEASAFESGQLTQGQRAAADRLSGQAASIASAQALQELADTIAAANQATFPVPTREQVLTDLANRGAIPAAAAASDPGGEVVGRGTYPYETYHPAGEDPMSIPEGLGLGSDSYRSNVEMIPGMPY